MLQGQKEEPPLDVKCRDKFLILSTFVDEVTEKMSITELVSNSNGINDNRVSDAAWRIVVEPC